MVPSIVSGAYSYHEGWRVHSADIKRGNQEDISALPLTSQTPGIVDFGVHDLGDPRSGKRTAIDMTIEWGLGLEGLDSPEAVRAAFKDPENIERALLLLAGWLGVSEEELGALGWRGRRPTMDEVGKVADALTDGDMAGANPVFDMLARVAVKNRTKAGDSIVVGKVRKALGKTVTLKDARELLGEAEARLGENRLEDDSVEPLWVTEMNTCYAFIHDRADGVLDTRGTETAIVRMLSLKEFDNIHANQFPPGEDRRKGNLASRWFRHRHRRQYSTAGDYPIGEEPG